MKNISFIGLLVLMFLQKTFASESFPPTTQAGVYDGILQVGRSIIYSGKQNQGGTGSYDNDSFNSGFTEYWRWDFDYKNSTFTNDAVTSSYLINYSYPQAGTYTVAVYYNDNDDQQGQLYTFNVTIQDGGSATFYLDQKTLSLSSQHFSRNLYSDFSLTSPNFSTNVTYIDEKGFADVKSSTGWTTSGDVTFAYLLGIEQTVRVGGPAWTSLKRIGGTGSVVARTDFYIDAATAGTPHVLAFEGNNYRFCVQYSPSTDKFQLQTNLNGTWNTPSNSTYQFELDAVPNQWYTVEMEKDDSGRCNAWVYKRGESRNYSDSCYRAGYPVSWNSEVVTYADYDYFYLSNYYVGAFSQTTTYSDGFGRGMQNQLRDGHYDIVSHTNYGFSGRDSIAWRAYRYSTKHMYDPNYSSHAQSEYGGLTNPYSSKEYFPDPMGRVRYVKPSGWTSSNEFTEYSYGAASVNGISHQYSEALQKPGSQTGNRVASRSYVDNLGRTVKTVLGNEGDTTGIISKSLYSITGQLLTLTDPDNIQSTSTYDFLGYPKSSQTVDAGSVGYVYDAAGRLRFMLDAAGLSASPDNVLYWKYDLLGRVIEKGYISQAWDTTSLNSQANNNSYPSTPVTWRKKYTYDGSSLMLHTKGKMVKIETNNDSDTNSEIEESYDYDRFGNIVAVHQKVFDFSSNTNSTFYSYDHLGKVLSVQYPIKLNDVTLKNVTLGNGQTSTVQSTNVLTVGPSYVVNSGATANLRATNSIKLVSGFSAKGGSIVLVKPEAAINLMVVKYTYNHLGQLIAIGSGSDSDYYAAYSYYSDGQLKYEKLNNSSKTVEYQFSHARRYLTGISSDIFSETLGYDNAGYNSNETFYNGLIGSASYSYSFSGSPSNYSYKYQYDKFGRLEIADNSVDNTADIGIGGEGKTIYTNNGRIDHIKRGTSSSTYYNYYSGTNKLQNTDGSGDDYTYDANGNTLSSVQKSITSMVYDPFYNKITSVTANGVTTNYQYDGAGERVLKTEGSFQTAYLRGLSSYPLMEKFSNGYERYYVYGPKGIVAMLDTGAIWFALKDHLGSTRLMINQSNTVVARYDYDPYGKKWRSSINVNIDYQFTGQEYDDEILLHNYRARMYDHDIGQFYGVDPANEFHNPYSYVGGNSISFTDPTGLKAAVDFSLMAAIAAEMQMWAMMEEWERKYGWGGGGGGGAGFSAEYSGVPKVGMGFESHIPSQAEINMNPDLYRRSSGTSQNGYWVVRVQSWSTSAPRGETSRGTDVFYDWIPTVDNASFDPFGIQFGINAYKNFQRANQIASEVLNEARKKASTLPGGVSGLHNGPADAWRHARWNERMVNEIGPWTAFFAGIGHELMGFFKKQPFAEMLMDLHNNSQGRTGVSADWLLQNGHLRIISPQHVNTGSGWYPMRK